jgi:hypothetical protein
LEDTRHRSRLRLDIRDLAPHLVVMLEVLRKEWDRWELRLKLLKLAQELYRELP